jgi:hypothetical protein
LLTTLVMLLLIGLVAVSSLGGSERNLRIAGNMQMRNETVAAAQSLIEQTISSALFTREPQALAAQPYDVDVDGDGVADYAARLDPPPSCLRVRPIRMAELDPGVPGDVACMGSSGLLPGGDYGGSAGGGNSLCHETTWNVAAAVADDRTGAQTRVNQGITVRIPVTDVANACP